MFVSPSWLSSTTRLYNIRLTVCELFVGLRGMLGSTACNESIKAKHPDVQIVQMANGQRATTFASER